MSPLLRSKPPPTLPSSNPYSGRGLDKFALLSADLQAQREKLAAKLGTPLSFVKFAIGSHSTWVPIIISPPDSKPSPDLPALSHTSPTSVHVRESLISSAIPEDAPPSSSNLLSTDRLSLADTTKNSKKPLSGPKDGKLRIYFRGALTKLAAKTLRSKKTAKKGACGSKAAAIDAQPPAEPEAAKKFLIPCRVISAASTSTVTPTVAATSSDSRPASDHHEISKKSGKEISAATDSTMKHQKSFPIKSLARIYSGPKSPKKKESSSEAIVSPSKPTTSAGGTRDFRHDADVGDRNKQVPVIDRSHQQVKRANSSSAMAMESKYEYIENVLQGIGFLLALFGLLSSYMSGIMLLVGWWYLLPIFRNWIGYRPVVVVDDRNQRQLPKYISIHNGKRSDVRRR